MDASQAGAPLQGNIVGKYLLRKRPGTLGTPDTDEEGGEAQLATAAPHGAGINQEAQAAQVYPGTAARGGASDTSLEDDSLVPQDSQGLNDINKDHAIDTNERAWTCCPEAEASTGTALVSTDLDATDAVHDQAAGVCAAAETPTAATPVPEAQSPASSSGPGSQGRRAPPAWQHAWAAQDAKHHDALLAAQAALQQAEEARSCLHAQLEDLHSKTSLGNDLAERLQALQDELEDRDAQLAASEGEAGARTQALRDLHIESGMAKATLLEALREGQERAAASHRPTARELHRVSADGTLLQVVTKFAGMYVALQDRYVEEAAQRRRLHNSLVDMKGAIRVFARLRPPLPAEASSAAAIECDAMGAVVDATTRLTGRAGGSRHLRFEYDAVFGPTATQDDVYAEAAPVVTSVLDGYHVCMFAYGQTGSGKTHTMQGTPADRGVSFRALEDLFRLVATRSPEADYEICVSLVEVYLEKIRDLLNTSSTAGNLEVKHNAHGSYLPGLVEKKVSCASEAQHWLRAGLAVRASAETAMNTQSSRSHCLLCIRTTGRSKLTGDVWRAKLWLVDLAGSERLDKSTIDQGPDAHRRLQEAQFINRSLAALGDCIHALASRAPHVPFRNSKLTYVLQDSLAGGSKTLMFVNVAPGEADAGESVCSLNFAARVRGVELGAVRRNIDAAADVRALQEQVSTQRLQMARMAAEQERLQQELKAAKAAASSPGPVIRPGAGGSPAQRMQQPPKTSPLRPWGTAPVAAQTSSKPAARFRVPAPRPPPNPASKAAMRMTPRATPRSAVHKLVGRTLRRASHLASGVVRPATLTANAAKASAQSLLRAGAPASALKSSSMAHRLPAAPGQSGAVAPPEGRHRDAIQAVHAPAMQPARSQPPVTTAAAPAASHQYAAGGSRPPMVPRLNLPARPPSSTASTPRDSARSITPREEGAAPSALGQATAGLSEHSSMPAASAAQQDHASLAKFMSYYHSSQQPAAGSGQDRPSLAGAARVPAPQVKTPALWSRPERTPMPTRHKPS